jgi:hypothetical protein
VRIFCREIARAMPRREAPHTIRQFPGKKPGFPLQLLGFAHANPAGFPLQSLARQGFFDAATFAAPAARPTPFLCINPELKVFRNSCFAR